MEKLAELCDHCRRTGLEPVEALVSKNAPQPPCRVCNGTRYKLTDRGENLREFVVSLMGDDDVRDEALKFIQVIQKELGSRR
jgi:hypothetical protein